MKTVLRTFLGGGLLLKRLGHPIIGIILLLFLAVPGLLAVFMLLLLVLSGASWI